MKSSNRKAQSSKEAPVLKLQTGATLDGARLAVTTLGALLLELFLSFEL
jgi:hypothetical protein